MNAKNVVNNSLTSCVADSANEAVRLSWQEYKCNPHDDNWFCFLLFSWGLCVRWI